MLTAAERERFATYLHEVATTNRIQAQEIKRCPEVPQKVWKTLQSEAAAAQLILRRLMRGEV